MSAGPRPGRGSRRHLRGLGLWLLVLLLTLLVFRTWPQIDPQVSRLFHDPTQPTRFIGDAHPLVHAVYQVVPHVGRWLSLISLVLVCIPRRRFSAGGPQRWRGRAIGLLAMLVLGLGLMVNWALKEHVGRPRPVHTLEFGGTVAHQPVGQVSTLCETNCSFVSGHAATGFVLIGIGLGAGPIVRRRWWAIGLVSGLLVGAGRVMQGGHFLSDILFAGLFMAGLALVVRWAWVGWRWRRRSRRRPA